MPPHNVTNFVKKIEKVTKKNPPRKEKYYVWYIKRPLKETDIQVQKACQSEISRWGSISCGSTSKCKSPGIWMSNVGRLLGISESFLMNFSNISPHYLSSYPHHSLPPSKRPSLYVYPSSLFNNPQQISHNKSSLFTVLGALKSSWGELERYFLSSTVLAHSVLSQEKALLSWQWR